MAAYKFSNGKYLWIEHNFTHEWIYTIYDEDGKEIDGGMFDDDHYPNEHTAIVDILYSQGLERCNYKQVPDEVIWEFEEMTLDEIREPENLEMGFDPYLGCYTDDC